MPASVVTEWWQRDDVEPWLLTDPAGTPVAYGEVWDDADEDEQELARLIVDPTRRRTGIGTRLVGRLIHLAHSSERASCFIRVAPDNAGALALYHRCGFRDVDDDTARTWNEGQPRAYRWLEHHRADLTHDLR